MVRPAADHPAHLRHIARQPLRSRMRLRWIGQSTVADRCLALRFITVGLGSLGLGAAIGLALALLTKRARDANLHIKPHEEIGLVSLSAYGAYVVANAAGLSGILALFFCAICLSHYAQPNLSEEAQRTGHACLHLIDNGFRRSLAHRDIFFKILSL